VARYVSKIVEIIDSQGRKKSWVAEQIGVSVTSINNWDKGEAMIPYDKARKLAQVLGVTMEELYEEL
jgi:transcriptional regulator with XRE-family HTH domain